MLRNTRYRLRNAGCLARSYFDGKLREREGAEWFFLLTPPNSGSTALARLLVTASRVACLNEPAEGQWLVPQMRSAARWDPGHPLPYRTIRAVWLQRLRQVAPAGEVLVVEKSPANLCRYRSLVEAMRPMPSHLATLIRDPYATIGSWDQRYGPEVMSAEWGACQGRTAGGHEGDHFRYLASVWLERAAMVLAARSEATVNLRYEDLCEDLPSCLRLLATAAPMLNDIDPAAMVRVKDYPPQSIQNLNSRQYDRLSPSQIGAINQVLAEGESILQELGYALRGKARSGRSRP